MKKLMFVALALIGLVAADASARYGYYGRCGTSRCCPKVCQPKVCGPKCPEVVVTEAPKPTPKCCVRYVRVEEPCIYTKYVDTHWTCKCPSTCREEFGSEANFTYEEAGEATGVY